MKEKGIHNLTVVSIDVWHNKAYLPIQAQYESGLYVDIDPVYVVSLNPDELRRAIQSVKNAGIKCLPDPRTKEEFRKRKDPVLAVSGSRSWKQLAKTGASYTIGWTNKEVRIDMSRLDKQGRWEYDPNKVRILPNDVPIDEIVKILLEDIETRPELFRFEHDEN